MIDDITRNIIDTFKAPPGAFHGFSKLELAQIGNYIKHKENIMNTKKGMTEEERDERKHALISPSSLKRTANCYGSVAKLKLHPHLDIDSSNEHTASGNKTGAILEEYLNCLYDDRFQSKPQAAIPASVFQDCEPDRKERILAIGEYLKGFRKDIELTYNSPEYIYFGQEERYTSWAIPGGEETVHGSPDIAIAWRTKEQVHIAILDLKDGRNAIHCDTPQLVAYAAGFMRHLVEIGLASIESFGQIHLGILQPRIDNFDHRVVRYSDLIEEIKELKSKTELAFKLIGEPEETVNRYLIPSEDACVFCKVKSVCPAFQAPVKEFFEPIVIDDTSPALALTEEQKVRLVANFKLLKTLYDDIKKEFVKKLIAGETIEGLKLVATKAPQRVWAKDISVDARRALLRKAGANPTEIKDLPLTDIEKQLGTAAFASLNLTEKKEFGYTVAPLNDRRKEIKEIKNIDFEVIDDEE